MSEITQRKEPNKETESGQATADEQIVTPAGDIFEHEGGITLLLDLPGVSRDRLDIQSDRNTLVVEGTVAVDLPEGTEAIAADIRSRRYRRTFSLSGEQLDTEAVSASLKDGVLRIEIPKRAELQPRRIEVSTG